MSKDHLIPKKRTKPKLFRQKNVEAWMATDRSDQANDDRGEERITSIENLEGRRGSIPLARLMDDEADFFELIEKGNLTAIEKFLNEHHNLNINCINYKGVSALHIAIKKEHLAIVRHLLQRSDIEVKDAALHAVATGNIELAEEILDALHTGSEMRSYEESPDYSADITPLILAAQLGHYEMVRMLLERRHFIEKPHIPSCICARCKELIREAGAAFPQVRLNAYKAISNPAYIVQVTNDPVLYGFVLDRELEECAITDKELRAEYAELAQQVRDFTVELLSKCRSTSEIETLLKLPWGYEGTFGKIEFPRLQLALDYKQKEFVAHSMVQQVLSSYWLGEFIKWPRLRFYQKCFHVLLRTLMFPIICILLLVPQFKYTRKLRAPVNRYLLSLASYLLFLFFVFLLNYLDTGNFNRGPPKTGCEPIIIIFVIGFIFSTMRQFFVEGWRRFFSEPWHWYDMVLETLYVVTFILWMKSFFDVSADEAVKKKVQERKFWHKYDATLLHEGLFAFATVLGFGRLAYYCLQSSRLGPLQVSMGKMLKQIAFFLVFCFLIITSFSIPMARSYAYYTGMTQTTAGGSTRSQLPSFSSFQNSFSTFFWAMFGMSPVESTDVVVENLVKDKTNPVINTHDFTETVGIILFATYELIMMIALVNTLIAILSNTFQKVVDNSDVEFKFHRTKLWTHFFDASTIVPIPVNLLMTCVIFVKIFRFCKVMVGQVPGAKVAFSFTRCCYIKYEKEPEVDMTNYETLMTNLVQRYFRAKEEEG